MSFKPGDRVVCNNELLIVERIGEFNRILVGDRHTSTWVDSSLLKPAVPSTKKHLEDNDVWWWLNGDVVCVYAGDNGLGYTKNFDGYNEWPVNPNDKWGGPVAPGPKI